MMEKNKSSVLKNLMNILNKEVFMLENLKPERVFHYFEELTKIPRESGNEQCCK